MPCNCIEELKANINELYKGVFKKKQIESISVPTLLSFDGGGSNLTYNEAVLKLVGQKKEESVIVKHTYCPFCGIKIVAD